MAKHPVLHTVLPVLLTADVLQLYGLAVLVIDELPARLTGDDEMLWRLFYRRCGITKREFSHVRQLLACTLYLLWSCTCHGNARSSDA